MPLGRQASLGHGPAASQARGRSLLRVILDVEEASVTGRPAFCSSSYDSPMWPWQHPPSVSITATLVNQPILVQALTVPHALPSEAYRLGLRIADSPHREKRPSTSSTTRAPNALGRLPRPYGTVKKGAGRRLPAPDKRRLLADLTPSRRRRPTSSGSRARGRGRARARQPPRWSTSSGRRQPCSPDARSSDAGTSRQSPSRRS